MRLHIWILIAASLMGCDRDSKDAPPPPNGPAKISIQENSLANLNVKQIGNLAQYVAGNGRWDVRKTEKFFYAIQRERNEALPVTNDNGFYEKEIDGESYRTRVVLSFGHVLGLGDTHDSITSVDLSKGNGDVPLILTPPHPGQPGYTSYVIFRGAGVNIEVYEQARGPKRHFTQQALNDVLLEIADVQRHADTLESTGRIPVPERYIQNQSADSTLLVSDGSQPGIYVLKAWINTEQPGEVFARVFNDQTQELLSADSVLEHSTRIVGWASDPAALFPYRSIVRILEHEPGVEYPARFELWVRHGDGAERRLLVQKQVIQGWQR